MVKVRCIPYYQPTEALTVIDVNTGKNIAKKEMQENFLKVNIEAAEEIARQLRLRNISGIVIVDFINLEAKSAESELLNVFGAALKKDPVPTQIVEMQNSVLLRSRGRKSKNHCGRVCPDTIWNILRTFEYHQN